MYVLGPGLDRTCSDGNCIAHGLLSKQNDCFSKVIVTTMADFHHDVTHKGWDKAWMVCHTGF